MDKLIVLAFDLYGTLLSTDSIAEQLSKFIGPLKTHSVCTLWRRYQLEYTWRLNSMDRYREFSMVTRDSLRHALAEHEEYLTEKDLDVLMKAYDNLSAFSDVDLALSLVAGEPNLETVLFSNGSKTMVSNSVFGSKDLSPHAQVFQKIVTVDDIKCYKPSPESYNYLAKQVGKQQSEIAEIWLVSGNPFDIVGARSAGMRAVWVDRAGMGWKDAAAPDLQPTAIVRNLEGITHVIKKEACTDSEVRNRSDTN